MTCSLAIPGVMDIIKNIEISLPLFKPGEETFHEMGLLDNGSYRGDAKHRGGAGIERVLAPGAE
jgi:hypothetical protein